MSAFSDHTRGDTWTGFILTAVDDADEPLDFTGADVLFQVRTAASRTAPLKLELTSEALGGITIGTYGGQSAIIAAERAVDLPPATYYWDVQATMVDGQILTLAAGTWVINDDVSHA